MAYHRHDVTDDAGYQTDTGVPIFFEEEEKYGSGGYDSKDDPFSNQYQNEEKEKDEKEMTDFEKQIEDESKPKYDNKEVPEDELLTKAASEVNLEHDEVNKQVKKIKTKSIEDAINKAIELEKDVL